MNDAVSQSTELNREGHFTTVNIMMRI